MATFTGSFQSETLSRKVNFTAIIPTDAPSIYDPEKKAADSGQMKTFYLLHGWDGNHEDWLHNTRVAELAGKYNVAVIMPSGENGFYVNHPGSNSYGSFIGEELVDVTRQLFRLSDKREDTWIGGLSMGGYGALRNGLHYADQFGKIVALSSRILTRKEGEMQQHPINDQLAMIIGSYNMQEMPADMDIHSLAEQMAEADSRPELYLACGTEDSLLDENRELHELLDATGYSHDYFETPGSHDWDFWNEYLEKALSWLTETEN